MGLRNADPETPAKTLALIGPVYPYRGGIAHYTTLLAEALKAFYQVHIISFRRQYPSWLYPGQSDKDPSIEPLQINAEFILDPVDPWTWRKAAIFIESIKPQAVLLHWWTTFWAPAFFVLSSHLRRKKLPLIYLIHNVLPHEARPWDVWLTRLTLRKGNAFIVQTEQQKKRLLSLVPDASVSVQPHPVYDMLSHKRIPKQEAQQLLGISGAEPVILFFGIIRAYKGLQYLLDAVALLRDKGMRVHLIIAGEFWERKAIYLKKIEQLRLLDQVTIHDRYIPNEDVALYFSAADAFAAPYAGGTQSGAAKMAMGFGLPLVISQNIVDEAILANQGKGLHVVDPANSEALADAIDQVLFEPSNLVARGTSPEGHRESWEGMAASISGLISCMKESEGIIK